MINRVVLVGRLVRDPELRKTVSGISTANFTIAVDNPFNKGPNGEKTASFIPCVAWNQQAENLMKYIRKGSLVGVEGRLNQRTYDSRDGRKVQVIEVSCDNVQYLESKGNSNATKEETNKTLGFEPDYVPNNVEEEKSVSSIDVEDDDLPF